MVALGLAVAQAAAQVPPTPTPFLDGRARELDVPSTRTSTEAPPGLDAIRIGYFGPADPAHPSGGDLWLAASMAVEEANAGGGYHGLPFLLVPAWSDNPWAGGARDLARLAFDDRVLALIGGIDGPTTHLAEQVATKALLPLLSPVATDPTVTRAYVPWVLSLQPSDAAIARPLAEVAATRVGDGRLAVVASTDHDSHIALVELRRALSSAGVPLSHLLELDPGSPGFESGLGPSLAELPAAALIVAGPNDSARAVQTLRRMGLTGPVLGAMSFARRRFLEALGPGAGEVIGPQMVTPSATWDGFACRFAERSGRRADFAAAGAYDAVRLLVAAIHQAGLERSRIAEALRALSPFAGVAGEISFDSLGQNQRQLRAVEISAPVGGPTPPTTAHADGERP